MPTPQQNAITAAQNLANLMARYIQLTNGIALWAQDNTKNNWDQYWVNMPTIPVNSDGTLGTQDGTLNNAHPINAPAGTPLLISRNALINGVNLIASLQSLSSWTSGAITTPNQNPLITAAIMAPDTLGS